MQHMCARAHVCVCQRTHKWYPRSAIIHSDVIVIALCELFLIPLTNELELKVVWHAAAAAKSGSD